MFASIYCPRRDHHGIDVRNLSSPSDEERRSPSHFVLRKRQITDCVCLLLRQPQKHLILLFPFHTGQGPEPGTTLMISSVGEFWRVVDAANLGRLYEFSDAHRTTTWVSSACRFRSRC